MRVGISRLSNGRVPITRFLGLAKPAIRFHNGQDEPIWILIESGCPVIDPRFNAEENITANGMLYFRNVREPDLVIIKLD